MLLNHLSFIIRNRFALRAVMLTAIIAFARTAFGNVPAPRESFPVQDRAPAVKVTTHRDGACTHFYVENDELCEITMSFEVGMQNLTSTAPFPYTATFPANKTTEAFVLTPAEKDVSWEYSYTNYYKLGSSCARHDDNVLYRLPYAPGSRFKVTQGYNGSFSHKGSNQYAIDWQMPEGTPVFAAREGLVVKTKDDSNVGGSSMKFDPFNNYVLIRHPDGTLGHYCHLQKGGVTVKPGQYVRAGELIAHSGTTGFSSGPHLHFSVFKTRDGKERVSLPVKFQTADGKATTLAEGKRYTSPEIQTAVAPSRPAVGGASRPVGGSSGPGL